MFLSFASEEENLGCCIVEASDMVQATIVAKSKRINPGGQVLGFEMTQEQFDNESLDKDKLYSREELISLGYKTIAQAEGE